MEKGNYLSKILRAENTVFSSRDIMLLWQDTNTSAAKVRVNYYVKRGELYRIRRGFYAKDKYYNKLELVNKIFTPSYVSFETVLVKSGVIFQYYDEIFAASYLSRSIIADAKRYTYRRLRDTVLTNSLGIEQVDNYSIASTERAFLDVLYLYSDYHFDNLSGLNWERVHEILPIYGINKAMHGKVKKHQNAA